MSKHTFREAELVSVLQKSHLSLWGHGPGSAAFHVRPAGLHRAGSSRASMPRRRRHQQPTCSHCCLYRMYVCVVRPLSTDYFECVRLKRVGVISSHLPFLLTDCQNRNIMCPWWGRLRIPFWARCLLHRKAPSSPLKIRLKWDNTR